MFPHNFANLLGNHKRHSLLAFAFNKLNNSLNLRMNIRTTDSQDQVIRHRYRTRSQARKMAEETDARIERLEKESQESRA